MLRLRTLLASTFATLLVVVLAAPAHAGPAPLDEGGRAVTGGTGGTSARARARTPASGRTPGTPWWPWPWSSSSPSWRSPWTGTRTMHRTLPERPQHRRAGLPGGRPVGVPSKIPGHLRRGAQ